MERSWVAAVWVVLLLASFCPCGLSASSRLASFSFLLRRLPSFRCCLLCLYGFFFLDFLLAFWCARLGVRGLNAAYLSFSSSLFLVSSCLFHRCHVAAISWRILSRYSMSRCCYIVFFSAFFVLVLRPIAQIVESVPAPLLVFRLFLPMGLFSYLPLPCSVPSPSFCP